VRAGPPVWVCPAKLFMNDSILPHLNATLNATSFVLLVLGFYFIRRGNIRGHVTCMVSALSVSILFLVSYVVYHYNYGSVRFTGRGLVRPVYLTILLTHVVLAIVIVPLVILTVRRALRRDFIRHRRVARWTYPLWLYVSVTGVIVYLMLYRLYPPG
jgi:uncharacterized membrane protein YozB (DUF420 family)